MGILRLRKRDPKAGLAEIFGDYELPSFPRIVSEAIDKISVADVNLSEVGELLGRDPGVSTKLLGIVNSATFSPRRPVTSVAQAVAMLGRNQVESMLISFAVKDAMSTNSPEFDYRSFWGLSARRAAMAARLAAVADPPSKSAAFTAALLQDMAVPVLSARVGGYTSVHGGAVHSGHALVIDEEATFGWHHAEVGELMAQAWGFPDELASVIGEHHAGAGHPPATLIANTAALLPLELDDAAQEVLVEQMRDLYGMAPESSLDLLERSHIEGRDIASLFA
jgi:HD-like signal output (HDOD) protein